MLEDIEIFMPRHMCQLNNCIVYKIRESLQRKMVLYFENFAGSHEHIIQMGNFSPAALSYVSTACTNYRFVLVSTSYFCVITFCTLWKQNDRGMTNAKILRKVSTNSHRQCQIQHYKLMFWPNGLILDQPDQRVIYSHLTGFQTMELGEPHRSLHLRE